MSMALNATGRPILYSMCNWGEDGPWNFAVVSVTSSAFYKASQLPFKDIANSWRISGDIYDVGCPNFIRLYNVLKLCLLELQPLRRPVPMYRHA